MNQTETEKNILVAAEEVFLEKGYQATSMLDISRRANCNQALVYYYYRSKENLYNPQIKLCVFPKTNCT